MKIPVLVFFLLARLGAAQAVCDNTGMATSAAQDDEVKALLQDLCKTGAGSTCRQGDQDVGCFLKKDSTGGFFIRVSRSNANANTYDNCTAATVSVYKSGISRTRNERESLCPG